RTSGTTADGTRTSSASAPSWTARPGGSTPAPAASRPARSSGRPTPDLVAGPFGEIAAGLDGPQRVHRSDPVTERERVPDRLRDEGLRGAGGLGDVVPEGETRRERGRERASGPVGVRCIDALAVQPLLAPAMHEEVGGSIIRQVPALHDHPPGPQPED